MEVWKCSPIFVLWFVMRDRTGWGAAVPLRGVAIGVRLWEGRRESLLTQPPLCSSLKHLLVSGNVEGKRYLDGTLSSVFEWERRCPWLSDCYFTLHVCTSARSWKDRVTRSYSVNNSCSASRHEEIHLFLATVLNNERRTESRDCILCVHRLPSVANEPITARLKWR